jgi:large subunit ribosomal protein L23
MALFGRKPKEPARTTDVVRSGGEKKEGQAAAPAVSQTRISMGSETAHILKNPRITEKATMHQGGGVYTFDVADSANKRSVAAAVAALYKVSPRKVRIVTVPAKRKRSARTGKGGMTRGGKKAYVQLAKGETITIT